MFKWFKKAEPIPAPTPVPAPAPVPVVVPEWVEALVPVQSYPKDQYRAYVEAIPMFDGSYQVRFLARRGEQVFEEHTVIGDSALKKLVSEYMVKYKV